MQRVHIAYMEEEEEEEEEDGGVWGVLTSRGGNGRSRVIKWI